MAEYKLRAVDSVREVEMIRRLGVEFRCGVEVDSAAALEAMEAEFDFVFLGLGLGAMQRLNIPGRRSLTGVMNALELIAAYKTAAPARTARDGGGGGRGEYGDRCGKCCAAAGR